MTEINRGESFADLTALIKNTVDKDALVNYSPRYPSGFRNLATTLALHY